MSIHPGLLGKYELRERLGQGGMAEVWKAYDQRLQRFVAIKFLHTVLQADPTFLSRFLREARAVASLRHPNIVQVYDFETSASGEGVGQQSLAYMVMDYIEGQTLANYLAHTVHVRHFLAFAEIVSLFFSISAAVDYAHQQGLLHRDIKPANILLDQRNTEHNAVGEPILTDFGIVKILGSSTSTLTSSAMGTPLYIAPEQALGQPADAASDLYSLGVVLYEMCTGTLPFMGSTPVSIIQQHIATQPPLPSSINPAIPPALDAVLLRALAKKPVERFASALALTTALARALALPLPARQGPALRSRELPASELLEPTLHVRDLPGHDAPSPAPLLGVDMSQIPTEVSELPHLRTQRAESLPIPAQAQVAPTRVSEPSRGSGPLAAGILSMRISSTPPRPFRDLVAAPRAEPPPPVVAPTPPPVPASRARKPRKLLLVASLCSLLIILGASVTVFLRTQQASASSQIVGNAFFTSSGDGLGVDNQGLNDIFQVHLTKIPAPMAGTQYYAWLLPDEAQTEASPRALGVLSLNAGVATLQAPYMDPQNANLVASFSRFLITEEPISPSPQSPALDTSLWRYYAELPQSASDDNCQGTNLNQLSVLCHLRHLLSGDPELAQVHLQGGLNYWFLNNVSELVKWARESEDHMGASDVRHKIANMLYLLDGDACVTPDLLHGASSAENVPDDNTITKLGAIPLMDCDQTPDSPGYISHIHNHLNAMLHSPGIQSNQVALATQIGTELNTLNAWLDELRSDARDLLAMDDIQLTQPAGVAKRAALDTLATEILSGGTDATTGMTDKGASNISDQIQQLAILNVIPYTTH